MVLAGMDAWANQHNTGEAHPELRPGAIVDENGNITNPNTAVDASESREHPKVCVNLLCGVE